METIALASDHTSRDAYCCNLSFTRNCVHISLGKRIQGLQSLSQCRGNKCKLCRNVISSSRYNNTFSIWNLEQLRCGWLNYINLFKYQVGMIRISDRGLHKLISYLNNLRRNVTKVAENWIFFFSYFFTPSHNINISSNNRENKLPFVLHVSNIYFG